MKKPIFSMFLIFAFIVLGCAKSDSKPKQIDIFVGIEGLTAEFAKSAPPPRVFENSKFPILLRVRNKGTYGIASDGQTFGVLSIGREKDYITRLSLEKSSRTFQAIEGEEANEIFFSVDGKTQLNPKGDEIVVSLNAKTGKLEPQSEIKPSTITATLCYPYQTVLSTTVCIDPDPAGIRPGKKVCNVKESSYNNGQGAPISVTKIEPQMIPEGEFIKPQFLIFIENKGKGNTVDIKSYDNVCGKNLDFDDPKRKEEIKNIWNVAFLRAYASGEKDINQLICCPNIDGQCPEQETNVNKITGFVRFRDRKDFVRCTFKNGVGKNFDAYTSPLRIEIDYGYVQTVATNFIIQKPIRY